MPLIILSLAPVIIMLTIAFRRNHAVISGFSMLSFIAAFVSLIFIVPISPYQLDSLFVIDGYAIFFMGVIIVSGFFLTLISYHYFEKHDEAKEEFYILLFLTALGSSVIVCANHFVSFFLGLEILSIAAYVLIAYVRKHDWSIEAAIKYLVMASLSSAILLFGMGLIYAGTGSMTIKGIENFLDNISVTNPVVLAGFVMFFVGVGFKLALVPFHMWTPDVYQGAPAPVAAMLATISKTGVFAFLLRFFITIYGYRYQGVLTALTVISIATMFVGNLLAMRQSNVKRILAYSSIAHMGYLFVALIAGNKIGLGASMVYLTVYSLTSLGAFGVISILSDEKKDAEEIADYHGLFWKKPGLAIMFTVMLLSLAGMPLTAGFFGKFFLIESGAINQKWALIISLVITSVISLYYYLKIVAAMFARIEADKEQQVFPALSYALIACLTFAVLWIGVAPSALIDIISGLIKKIII
jgi:NADH-quinone oxidoreductase subunit N